MEDVLEVYHRPYDEKRPLVCRDEASKQLVGEVVQPLPPEPGQPERYDYEYIRNGTANLFMVSEPLLGWRAVHVTPRRTAKDFAEVRRWLVEDVHPEAEKVVLVLDNLNTHKVASLYEAFEPEQARRIAERLEIHHTPKHGSWLNVAEVELSVLARQCLDRRIEDAEELRREVGGKRNETSGAWRYGGSSPRPTPASNSTDSTPYFNSGRLLVARLTGRCVYGIRRQARRYVAIGEKYTKEMLKAYVLVQTIIYWPVAVLMGRSTWTTCCCGNSASPTSSMSAPFTGCVSARTANGWQSPPRIARWGYTVR